MNQTVQKSTKKNQKEPKKTKITKKYKQVPTNTKKYPRATTKDVDRRASSLLREYTEKAKTIDTLYGGVPEGVVGPVQAQLHSFSGGFLEHGERYLNMSTSWSTTFPPLGQGTSSCWRGDRC